jgi:transposase
MKNVKETVGIDVSKLTLDVFIHTLKDHAQFENNRRGYLKILKWLKSKQINLNEVLFCFEHTGWYCIILSYFLKENSLEYCSVSIQWKLSALWV